MLEYARYVFLGVAAANLIVGGIVVAFVIGYLLPFSIFVEGKAKPTTEEWMRNVGWAIGIGFIVFYLIEATIIPAILYAVIAGPKKTFDVINKRLHRSVC